MVSAPAGAGLFNRAYRTERVAYAAPGGDTLYMTLYLPKAEAAGPRPAVALFHGGAWLMGTRHRVSWYARRLAEAGYVAATVTYRKLPRYPFPACVEDGKAAVRWLRSHAADYGIDPDRIAASGHSAGGHIAMMLGTTGSGKRFDPAPEAAVSARVDAVVSVYGAVDLTVYREPSKEAHLEGVARRVLESFLKELDAKAGDPLVVASPVTYIDGDSAPTLFVQGSEDWLVPPEVSSGAEKRLREAGVATRRVVVEGVGHGFDYFAPKRRPLVLEAMLDFLGAQLGATP